jgi:hypothetical protein
MRNANRRFVLKTRPTGIAGPEHFVEETAPVRVGQVAGQIGKIEACRVVGIAGSAEKCNRLTGELGFDAAIDYRSEPDLSAAIARACPDGIDVVLRQCRRPHAGRK